VLRTWRKTQLTERLAWGLAYHDGGYVFVQENGQPYHPEHLTKLFSRLCRPAGVPQVRLHDLRQLSASLDIAAGTDIAVVSKRLRHSSIKITADTYVHLKEQTSREAAQKAAALVPWRRPA
jgi:integrase